MHFFCHAMLRADVTFPPGPDYSFPADVYSFSMLVYFSFSGLRPFFELNDGVTCAKTALWFGRPQIGVVQSFTIRPLITKAWAPDPKKRPTMRKVVKELVGLIDTAAAETSSECVVS
jgi:hypothetical protein